MATQHAQSEARPSVSVVVPTYRRPDVLLGCLRALHQQEIDPLEVLVCYRSDDGLTANALESLPESDLRLVREVRLAPGENLAAGLRAGISESRGDLIALTDDDAEAHPDWISRLIRGFANPDVGGVGGRDIMQHQPEKTAVVGKVQWFGRRISNHQTGHGPARDVDVLKGVNCCFRGDLLRSIGIDRRLRGKGNVAHWELAICLPLARVGWRMVYDPEITLDHHVSQRMDGDVNQRGGFEPKSLRDIVHNETLMVWEHLNPVGKAAFLGWSTLLGTHFTPGLVAAIRTGIQRRNPFTMMHRFCVTLHGRMQGLATWLRSTEGALVTTAPSAGQREFAA